MPSALRDPVRLIPLLSLPIATANGTSAPAITALFTATSAVSVTGLIVVDTPTYWSTFGQTTILVLFQVGGFGIMSAATLLGLMVGRGFGLRDPMATQVERSRLQTGDARSVLKMVLAITVVVELAVAAILTIRLATVYGHDLGQALWHGLFHAVSAFNNAGFSTYSDSVMGFQSDPVMLVPIMFAVVLTALGFPVMQDLRAHSLRYRRWTLHSKITVAGTLILLAGGFVATLVMEWSNPDTLERMGHEVLGADADPEIVQDHAGKLTQMVEADGTELETLRRLGGADFSSAVVGIGSDIEASVLAVLALSDLGVPNIWAKATNERHGRILERTGAHHVVFPEQDMGRRVARLVNERLLHFISFGSEFAIARLQAPDPIVGLPLVTSQCRQKFDVTVIGVKREGEDFIQAVPDTIILPGDELVVSGRIERIEGFAALQ